MVINDREEINKRDIQIDKLEQSILSKDKEIEKTSETEETVDKFAHLRAKRTELRAGYHNVGNDGEINPGTYRVYALSGYGLIIGDLWQGYISETVGYSRHTKVTEKIDRIYLSKEDSFKIEGDCVLVFEPIE